MDNVKTDQQQHRLVEDIERQHGLVGVSKEWRRTDEEIHAESAIRGVFTLLAAHVSKGEIDDVIGTLPDPIKAYWPADRAA